LTRKGEKLKDKETSPGRSKWPSSLIWRSRYESTRSRWPSLTDRGDRSCMTTGLDTSNIVPTTLNSMEVKMRKLMVEIKPWT